MQLIHTFPAFLSLRLHLRNPIHDIILHTMLPYIKQKIQSIHQDKLQIHFFLCPISSFCRTISKLAQQLILIISFGSIFLLCIYQLQQASILEEKTIVVLQIVVEHCEPCMELKGGEGICPNGRTVAQFTINLYLPETHVPTFHLSLPIILKFKANLPMP